MKDLNPGIDLLMTGNWETIFDAETGPMPRDTAGSKTPTSADPHPAGEGGPPRAESRSPPPSGYAAVEVVNEQSEAPSRPRRMPWMRLGMIVGVITLSGFWFLRSRRPNPPDRN